MAPINNKNPNNSIKKQTGTVPKTSSCSKNNSSNGSSPSVQGVILSNSNASKNRTSNTSTSSSSRKNTEIVAPTRRELNDLNDYLISVSAETSKLQNSCNTGFVGNQSQLDASCFELDNINCQENQRFSYPVRPILRRNTSNKNQSLDFLSHNNTSGAANTSAAAVGVVIPTTPANNSGGQQNDLTNNCNSSNLIDPNIDLSWNERLNFIKYFLSLTSKSNNKKLFGNLSKMVNDKDVDVVMNSTSLEDLNHSENSDRAHSISSIHTLTGEPLTPDYDELQHRLESSNRNIQNIKDQQNQLLRLQHAAKQHLADMEDVRSRVPLRFGQSSNGNVPDYESVEAVHNDMSNLVNRMKNLQTFIKNQNELSEMLGEDSPDVLAEQELLQQKLNDLKSHRVEMKNLVSELQDINTTAERSILNREAQDQDNEAVATVNNGHRLVPIDYQRVVPIELVGNSKKTIVNGKQNGTGHQQKQQELIKTTAPISDGEDTDTMDPETAEMIQKKITDINTMKSQLQRLKDMMATVQLIEDKTGGINPQQVGRDEVPPKESTTTNKSTKRPIEIPASMQREFSKNFNSVAEIPLENLNDTNTPKNAATILEEQMMSDRVRLLHEMTADLREQAMGLASERDRLKAIKEEMKHRSCPQNLNTNQFDKNLNCQSLPRNNVQAIIKNEDEKDLLKAEYEAKKKEFDKICLRLQNEDENNEEDNEENDDDDENIDDVEKEQKDIGTSNYFTENWQQQHLSNSANGGSSGDGAVGTTSCNSSVHEKQHSATTVNIQSRGKDSADSGAVDVHGIASLEAGSMQSGSSRSYSMPPPMRTILMNGNSREIPWRKNSQDHSNSGQQPYDLPFGNVPQMPPAWNAYYYNPHFLQPSIASANSGSVQNIANDPALLQQFIQTQQTLINSVCHCNQILWNQQREINNLNHNLVLLQERVSNSVGDTTQNCAQNRADSVPPSQQLPNNLFASDSSPINRAHSEQPLQGQRLQPIVIASPQQVYQPILSPCSPHRFHQNGYNYGNFYQHYYHQQQHSQRRHNLYNSQQHFNYSNNMNATSVEPQVVYQIGNLPQNLQYPPRHASPIQTTVANSSSSDQQRSGQQNFLNNADTLNMQTSSTTSAHSNSVAPPIFMHHHNNNISGSQPAHLNNNNNINNNNSNLLSSQQNCLNSNQCNGSNLNNSAASASALNNQVPPGNRANNYWDNFRSYSRQNLLSSNSCKSNEEQNHQQMQQIQQHHLHQQQQTSSQQHPSQNITQFNTSNNFRNHQQAGHINGNISTIADTDTVQSTINSNNLNPPNFDNKYFHTLRNEFNSNGQPNEININPNGGSNGSLLQQTNRVDSSNLHESLTFGNIPNQHLDVNQSGSASSNLSNLNENIFDFNNASNLNGIPNNNFNNVATIVSSPDFRNMNLNFSINEQKKIPIKTSCNTKPLRHTQSAPVNIGNDNPFLLSDNIINNRGNSIENCNQNNIENVQQNDYRYVDLGEGAAGIDETSEEIKRNLLVNALKNDKFTSKFFETLKEDVYRQAQAIIQEKKSDSQFLTKLFEELKGSSDYDPLTNILIHSFQNLNNENRSFHETESNDGQNVLENFDRGDSNLNILTSSVSTEDKSKLVYQNIDRFNCSDSMAEPSDVTLDNIRDAETMESLLISKDMKMLAYKFMFGVNGYSSDQHQKNKFQVKKCDEVLISDSLTSNDSTKSLAVNVSTTSSTYRPDFFIVNYVMTKIRREISKCLIIDELTMVRIVKMTVAEIQEAISILGQKSIKIDRLEISPKDIYAKMQTFDKSDPEQFLTNYQNFLMAIINEDTNVNIAKRSRHQHDNNISQLTQSSLSIGTENSNNNCIQDNSQAFNNNCEFKSNISAGFGSSELKVENIDENKHKQQINLNLNNHSLFLNNNNSLHENGSQCTSSISNIINEDLAEADQINTSATNSLNSNEILLESNNLTERSSSLTILENSNYSTNEGENVTESERSIENFGEHDILGDNTSMNEEDQDDAEAAAEANARSVFVNPGNVSNFFRTDHSNKYENLSDERQENQQQQHYKKSHSTSTNNNTDDAQRNGCNLIFPTNTTILLSDVLRLSPSASNVIVDVPTSNNVQQTRENNNSNSHDYSLNLKKP